MRVGDQRHAPATLPPFFLSIRTNQTFIVDVRAFLFCDFDWTPLIIH
jgi:hypothetical protein